MTIFDRNSYLGGRSTTVPIKGDASRFGSLELGASIFVDVNKNLIKATDVFGLKRITPMVQKKNVDTKRPGLGVWNGDEFLFEESGGYWDNIKALWRYGLSPLKVRETLSFLNNDINIIELTVIQVSSQTKASGSTLSNILRSCRSWV